MTTGIAVIHVSEKDFDFDKIKPLINSCEAEVISGFYPCLIHSDGLTYEGFIL